MRMRGKKINPFLMFIAMMMVYALFVAGVVVCGKSSPVEEKAAPIVQR